MTGALIMMSNGKQSKHTENPSQNPFGRLIYVKVTA